MLNTATKTEATDAQQDLTDGFHLVIDALKLNGINTVYGVPGIPITDLGRMLQAEGIRVLSFRHEQNAGYAAAIAGFLTKKPGVCLTVSAPGFLNGLTALAHATINCFPMILISGSSEREQTDGFNLIIDALKLNGLTTIYGVPGIPITDFGRMAQAAGIRVISFRHEQNAGYAASIAG